MYDRDPDAFAELYDTYAPRIYRYIFFKVATESEAEDLTAEVFLKTWEYVQRREKRIANFRHFVYRLARNVVIDHYRERGRHGEPADREALERLQPVVQAEVLKTVRIASDMKLVERAIVRLRDEYREVIILRYIEDYPIFEIAKIVEKSNGAVRVTLHRALEALRDEVKKLEAEVTPS